MQLFSANAAMFSKNCPRKMKKPTSKVVHNLPKKIKYWLGWPSCPNSPKTEILYHQKPLNAGLDFGSTRSKTYFLQMDFSFFVTSPFLQIFQPSVGTTKWASFTKIGLIFSIWRYHILRSCCKMIQHNGNGNGYDYECIAKQGLRKLWGFVGVLGNLRLDEG